LDAASKTDPGASGNDAARAKSPSAPAKAPNENAASAGLAVVQPNTADGSEKLPVTTTEIPPLVPAVQSPKPVKPAADAPVVRYDLAQPNEAERQSQDLQEFLEEGENRSPLGIVMRESQRRLDDGGDVDGLLIVNVRPGSPAARAGLLGYSAAGRDVLEGAAIAAALFFPPAILAVAVLDDRHVGESYDMIIGVDGRRVANFIDFEDHMRNLEPGEIVYLSILRNNKRIQVPVELPRANR
jgi:hypothetical protein